MLSKHVRKSHAKQFSIFLVVSLFTFILVVPVVHKFLSNFSFSESAFAEVDTPIVTVTPDATMEPTQSPTPEPTTTPTPKLIKENVINAINKHLDGRLANKGEEFYFAGSLYNVNPMLLAAICKQESANGKSNAINKKSNPSGFMADSNLGILRTFDDVDHGIVETARLLKERYINKGLRDIESIGGKYCPVGATNDPNGLNKHWVPNVTKFYIEILHDAERGI